jgi:hypothetical protein
MPAYPVVEALEAARREADRGRGCEVKVAAVKEVKEGVLEDLCPHFEVGEVGIAALLKANTSQQMYLRQHLVSQ